MIYPSQAPLTRSLCRHGVSPSRQATSGWLGPGPQGGQKSKNLEVQKVNIKQQQRWCYTCQDLEAPEIADEEIVQYVCLGWCYKCGGGVYQILFQGGRISEPPPYRGRPRKEYRESDQ